MSTRQGNQGFTLIELLFVMVIMAIIASMAVLSVGALGRDPPAEKAARQIADLTDLASQEAVMQGQEYGLRIEPHAYQFFVYADSGWLSPKEDALSGRHVVDDSVTLALTLEGAQMTLAPSPSTTDAQGVISHTGPTTAKDAAQVVQPQVLLLSSGELTPFTLSVRGMTPGAGFTVSGSLLKGIQMMAPDEHAKQ